MTPDPIEELTAEEACIANAIEPPTGETTFEVEIGARVALSKDVIDKPSDTEIASVLDIDILLTSTNDSAFKNGDYVWIYTSLQNLSNKKEYETATCLIQYFRG